MEKWTENEIKILYDIYPLQGSSKTAKILGKTRKSVINKASRENIKYIRITKNVEAPKHRRHKWTDSEIAFLSANFYNLGIKKCAEHLNIASGAVASMAYRIGLRQSPEVIRETRSRASFGVPRKSKNINVNIIARCDTPDIAYVLGFLWADGYFISKPHRIGIGIKSTDFEDVYDVFSRHIHWYSNHRTREGGSSKQSIMEVNDLETFNFLNDYGYKSWRKESPEKIINHVGKFAPYWFRGFFDGDGCFYYNESNKVRHASFAGSYHQNWNFICCLLNTLGIKYRIDRRQQGKYKSSVVRISNLIGIIKFGNYIYGDNYDDMGLKRKHDKFLQISSSGIRSLKAPDIFNASFNENGLYSPKSL